MEYITGYKLKLRKTLAAITAIFLVLLLLLTSCSGTTQGNPVTLKLQPGSVSMSVSESAPFNVGECLVLRCANFVANETEITANISKAKGLTATTLVFVKLDEGADYMQIAASPITGKEYEYDITQAKFYKVERSSIAGPMADYGIPYNDWQTGAVSNSEKFPCCE